MFSPPASEVANVDLMRALVTAKRPQLPVTLSLFGRISLQNEPRYARSQTTLMHCAVWARPGGQRKT